MGLFEQKRAKASKAYYTSDNDFELMTFYNEKISLECELLDKTPYECAHLIADFKAKWKKMLKSPQAVER